MKKYLGIEFGSTRIKGVLINDNHQIIASGSFNWENQLVNGIWTYSLDLAKKGLQDCFKELKENYENKYNEKLTHVDSIGISGMMHGYLVFDKDGNQLAQFRTWRNTITENASNILSKELDFHIPQRWSIAHIYQAILNKEPEVKSIAFATTLAGYFHYLLTGEKVVGIGEASGIFPIDMESKQFDRKMLQIANNLMKKDIDYKIEDIFPKVLVAGQNAGHLTKNGSLLLDPTGELEIGAPFCPPEGDMGTGMVCTNSVLQGTGNASIGTSSNITIITGKNIGNYPEIDIITTPTGANAALIHVNNGTSEINVWEKLFKEAIHHFNENVEDGDIFNLMFNESLKGDKSCKGYIPIDYFSGEPVTKVNEGKLVMIREPDAEINLANFMRSHIYSLLGTIRLGIDILREKENIQLNKIVGHGGFFKTQKVGQLMLSSALDVPVVTLDSASEGGPYGQALLASYLIEGNNQTLEQYLNKVFKDQNCLEIQADKEDVAGFNRFLEAYKKALFIEKEAIKTFNCKKENTLQKLKETVYKENMRLVEDGLVTLTWGNVSGIDRELGLVVIKPSGVPYASMKVDDMVVIDLEGNIVEGHYKPSSDTPTHLELYKRFQNIGGVVHTHSTFAVGWAQSKQDIPAYGTTHADTFYGNIPCTRELAKNEIENEYELNTGKVIVETFKDKDYEAIPGVNVGNHGPFAWGKSPKEAVDHAVILEEVAKMAIISRMVSPNISEVSKELLNKHYNRKHGKDAYYGQGEKDE